MTEIALYVIGSALWFAIGWIFARRPQQVTIYHAEGVVTHIGLGSNVVPVPYETIVSVTQAAPVPPVAIDRISELSRRVGEAIAQRQVRAGVGVR